MVNIGFLMDSRLRHAHDLRMALKAQPRSNWKTLRVRNSAVAGV
jgi:hypothetical protein